MLTVSVICGYFGVGTTNNPFKINPAIIEKNNEEAKAAWWDWNLAQRGTGWGVSHVQYPMDILNVLDWRETEEFRDWLFNSLPGYDDGLDYLTVDDTITGTTLPDVSWILASGKFFVKMLTFNVVGMPYIFSVIWFAMTLMLVWAIVNLVRGTSA